MNEVASRRVVIAEDEALIRMDLAEMLAEEGYDVVGQAGRRREGGRADRAERPDLVILDVKMPKLDGIAAAERIAAQRIAPVVILTAFSQRDLVERARDAGAMAYLVKPFTKDDLVPAIEMAVSRFAEISRSRPRSPTWPSAWRPARSSTAPRECSRRSSASASPSVPLDPEDRHGPAAVDAPGRRRRGRARRRRSLKSALRYGRYVTNSGNEAEIPPAWAITALAARVVLGLRAP